MRAGLDAPVLPARRPVHSPCHRLHPEDSSSRLATTWVRYGSGAPPSPPRRGGTQDPSQATTALSLDRTPGSTEHGAFTMKWPQKSRCVIPPPWALLQPHPPTPFKVWIPGLSSASVNGFICSQPILLWLQLSRAGFSTLILSGSQFQVISPLNNAQCLPSAHSSDPTLQFLSLGSQAPLDCSSPVAQDASSHT